MTATGPISDRDVARSQTLLTRFTQDVCTTNAALEAAGLPKTGVVMIGIGRCTCCNGPKFKLDGVANFIVKGRG